MSNKKQKKNLKKALELRDGKHIGYDYDASAPDAPCLFCGSAARYYVEYECGNLQHRHGQLPTCKSCTWILSSSTGGQYTIYTKAFDGRAELAQMKSDALNAVQKMLNDGRINAEHAHENDHLKKTDHRIPRNIWE